MRLQAGRICANMAADGQRSNRRFPMNHFFQKAILAAICGLSLGLVLLLGRSGDTGAYAQLTSLPTCKQLMKSAEFTSCGLNKLSERELANLDLWLQAYTKAVSSRTVPVTPAVLPNTSTVFNFSVFEGGEIIASDGQFLGILSNDKYNAKSIANKYGTYGSKYNTNCIWNKYSSYGSEYSNKSPYNRYTSKPPVICRGGKVVAYLTVNTSLSPRVDPNQLMVWAGIER
jgi:hypothetical protein